MKEKLTVLIGEKEIQSRVEKLAAEISESYKGESLLVVGILRGAIMFMVDLLKKLEIDDVQIDFMAVSSYGSSTVSSGKINIKKDLSESIEGRNVLIVFNLRLFANADNTLMIQSNTLYHLIEYLQKDNPKSVKLCTLFDKPERREKEVPVDWVGFDIPNKFIVGYGLDYAQRYRNLPYIAELAFVEDENEN
jgi:hypoxanthine phosphoribosyltransferase